MVFVSSRMQSPQEIISEAELACRLGWHSIHISREWTDAYSPGLRADPISLVVINLKHVPDVLLHVCLATSQGRIHASHARTLRDGRAEGRKDGPRDGDTGREIDGGRIQFVQIYLM